MANYLVTGVAGFIGSALAEALLARGDSVRGIDNFASGKPENIAPLLGGMDFRRLDVADLAGLRQACEGMDYVLHQAAIPSVPRSVADPIATNRANIDGTLNLLVAAREAGIRRVVYASSSSVYGDTPTLPKREDMPPLPISPYAVSKLAGECYMRSFHLVYGLETVSLRYFNIFGPRQDANSQYSAVLARFITSMLSSRQPMVYGDGEQTRDFTYIDNVVAANLLACALPSQKVAGRVFNIAGGRQTSLHRVLSLLREITGFAQGPAYAPPRPGDVKHSLADISLARQNLDYEVVVGFEQGLEKTVDWYRRQGARSETAHP